MLAALNCDERDRYNLFVTRFRQPLIHESAALRAYFQRRHSAGATRRTAATRRVRRSGASVHFDATE